jgi:hypothetical protein
MGPVDHRLYRPVAQLDAPVFGWHPDGCSGVVVSEREVLRCGKRRRINGRCLSIRLADDAPR